MVTKEQIARINALAAKKKAEGLTEEELQEQAELRKIYIAAFRENFESQLKNIEIVDPDDERLKNAKEH
ncbi:MAG: DUF896 domain-containing protein [Bacillota bacterium]|nr:DUF896 domain-containing protein [Bacillota bacterium]